MTHSTQAADEAPGESTNAVSRRDALCAAAGMVAAGGLAGPLQASAPAAEAARVTKGRIKQSLVHWCYSKYWDVEAMAKVARDLGCVSIELIAAEHWPTLKKYGLTCAIGSSHGFVKGMCNPKYHDETIARLRSQIDACAEGGVPSVITFTGMREDISDEAGMKHCVEGYKQVMAQAERKKVTLCLEMLNSRVNVTMKGHPGYMGDHMDWCVNLVKKVDSERMKVLFDIYHVQIMDGDVITRLRQFKDHIGHVHTAGVPGRRELDDQQEINYKPIMAALIDIGYQGYVGQEYIPTRDALAGLREAVQVCDV